MYECFILQNLTNYKLDVNLCSFYLRMKNVFITYHTTIYDQPFKCQSYVISFTDPVNNFIFYGNIIVFMHINLQFYAFIQKYKSSQKSILHYVDIPIPLQMKVDELFPLVELSDEFMFIPVEKIRHKCVKVPFDGVFCLSEIRLDYEHD